MTPDAPMGDLDGDDAAAAAPLDASPRLDFRVLGPLEVRWDGVPMPLGSVKPQALLARLLVARGRVVPSEQLLDDLWPGEPPEAAEIALRSLVSRLRRRLRDAGVDREVVVTRAPGYLVDAGDDELDAARFERWAREARRAGEDGDVEHAARLFDAALDEWHGSAYGELAGEPFIRPDATRLEELRLSATEERIDALLMLGRHRELVGVLESLTRAHPLRERLWAQRMIALYRSGRQAEALHAYQDVRRLLDEELGLQPSPMLIGLERDILRQRSELDLVPSPRSGDSPLPSPVPAPAPGDALVGRDAELAQLVGWWHEADSAPAQIALVSGEPGIGKTRLAREFVHRVTADGGLALVGACDEETPIPYQPFVELLRDYVNSIPSGALQSELGWRVHELSRLLPELGGEPQRQAGHDPETERYRFFEAVTSLLVHAAQQRRLLIVVDDLHWADKPTLLLLRHLLRAGRPVGPLILGTYRDTELAAGHPLRELLHDLGRQGDQRRLMLTGLGGDAVRRLLEERAAPTWNSASLADDLTRVTEGNPLFVTELMSHLADYAGKNDEPLTELPGELVVPEGLKELIGRRVSRLTESANRLLTVAAVVGPEWSAEVVGRTAGIAGDTLLEALEEAVDARVIEEIRGRDDWYTFSHSLVRQSLYESLLSSRRMRMHLRVAEVLEELEVASPGAFLVDLAHHHAQASSAGDRRKAVAYARRAGDRAQEQLAFEEAIEHYRRALGFLDTLGSDGPVDRCDLLIALGAALSRSADPTAAAEAFVEAGDIAEAIEDVERMARAALREGPMVYRVSRPHLYGSGEITEIVQLRRAENALGDTDSPLLAQVKARLGLLIFYAGQREVAAELSEAALAIARRSGDRWALGASLNSRLHSWLGPDRADVRRQTADELFAIAEASGDHLLAFTAGFWQIRELLTCGDVASAADVLPVFERYAERTRHPLFLSCARSQRGTFAFLRGDLADAEHLAAEALTLGERHDDLALSLYGAQMLWTWWQKGVLPSMEAAFLSILEQAPSEFAVVRAALAILLAETGRTHEARAQLDHLSDNDFEALAEDETDGLSMAWASVVCERVHDAVLSKALYERLEPYRGSVVSVRPPTAVCVGPADHYLGLLAVARGDLSLARAHLEDALALAKRMGARPFATDTGCELGGVLVRMNERTTGEALLEAAAREATSMGLTRIAGRARDYAGL